MSNLAVSLWNRSELTAARSLEEEILAASRRVLGSAHPRTLSALTNLAITLRSLGDEAGAKELEAERERLERSHPG